MVLQGERCMKTFIACDAIVGRRVFRRHMLELVPLSIARTTERKKFASNLPRHTRFGSRSVYHRSSKRDAMHLNSSCAGEGPPCCWKACYRIVGRRALWIWNTTEQVRDNKETDVSDVAARYESKGTADQTQPSLWGLRVDGGAKGSEIDGQFVTWRQVQRLMDLACSQNWKQTAIRCSFVHFEKN